MLQPPRKKKCLRTKQQQKRERDQRRREAESSPETESRQRERTGKEIKEEEKLNPHKKENQDGKRRGKENKEGEKLNLPLKENQDIERGQRRREAESTPEREARLQQVRTGRNAARMRTWRILENAALNYDPSADHTSDPSCIIGAMSVICEHCEAKKWKGKPQACAAVEERFNFHG
ncbi:hypothetical protein AVEN_240527-1 [Araneus ventricosus]|uniref:Uncharacterized protein n=1 Tax=Araneus ventricosus TaxID=182803 RepID=A0A4Y2L6D1_ARAVE|nr:hypothetical protein AVEN_240527-1 [Araneus ventricosus]